MSKLTVVRQNQYRSQVGYPRAVSCAGCVDDCAPIGPSLHARGYGWTCILLSSSHNSNIRILPESNERISVVEYNQALVLLCLANVYLPARVSTEDEEGFGECLDMLHEIILKYNSSHTVIIGGDFNSSTHRGSGLRRDRLFMEFVIEHRLNDGVDYPVGDTFFHASNDSSSQIDYFLVAGSPSWSPLIKITIAYALPQYVRPHPPWAEPEADVPLSLPEPSSQDQVRDIKIRWDKCDTSLYKEIMQESLLAAPLLPPLSALDADLCVRSLTKVLHVAAKVASPLQRKKRSRNGFPIWNERVAAAGQSSKAAHYRWKRAGCPRGNSLLTVKSVINDKFLFTQLILDCASDTIASRVLLCPHRVESVSRHLCFALHLKRCKLINQPV